MLVYAGIDEAGYSPLLGPLCVACTVFVIQDDIPQCETCDLWRRLKKAICRKRTDRRRRIAIDDSKKLKNPNDGAVHPLRHLERGVLAFHMAASAPSNCPACDGDLFRYLAVDFEPSAWYASTTNLPVAHTHDELHVDASRLRRALAEQGVCCHTMRCQAIDGHSFNRQVQATRNKLNVNVHAVMKMIDAIWNLWRDHNPQVVIDRQGGRTHYLDDLMIAWPDASVRILAESEQLSRYQVEHNGSILTLSFMMNAESSHLPVALASMTAKYVRELMMIRLNRYFQGLMPELKPTAGYTQDARRYLADIDPLIERLGVDRGGLIRSI